MSHGYVEFGLGGYASFVIRDFSNWNDGSGDGGQSTRGTNQTTLQQLWIKLSDAYANTITLKNNQETTLGGFPCFLQLV